jgi:hypothetical protein
LDAVSVSCALRIAIGVSCSVGVSKHNNSYGYPTGGERNDDSRKQQVGGAKLLYRTAKFAEMLISVRFYGHLSPHPWHIDGNAKGSIRFRLASVFFSWSVADKRQDCEADNTDTAHDDKHLHENNCCRKAVSQGIPGKHSTPPHQWYPCIKPSLCGCGVLKCTLTVVCLSGVAGLQRSDKWGSLELSDSDR